MNDDQYHCHHHDKAAEEFKEPKLKGSSHPDNVDDGRCGDEPQPYDESADDACTNARPAGQ